MSWDKAVNAIEKHGILLVFPIKNEREPASLWYALYPRSPMRWDWSDETADDRVVNLWHLRTELSESTEVVYTKWFKNRATFFARDVFVAALRILGAPDARPEDMGPDAAAMYRLLLDDSPQTARMLRAEMGLDGRIYESAFNRAQRPLWSKLLTVGFGEVDEGSYPSLAIGATKNLFEDLWDEARALDVAEARARFDARVPADSPFHVHLRKLIGERASKPRRASPRRRRPDATSTAE